MLALCKQIGGDYNSSMSSLPKRRSDCPVNVSLEILGDRWTLLIVRDLVFSGKAHYRAFLDSPEGIATNILADRLRKLEAAGIVTKSPDPENRSRSLYALTDKGLDLIPLLLELVAWSARHEETGTPRKWVVRYMKDRAGLIEELRERAQGAATGD